MYACDASDNTLCVAAELEEHFRLLYNMKEAAESGQFVMLNEASRAAVKTVSS